MPNIILSHHHRHHHRHHRHHYQRVSLSLLLALAGLATVSSFARSTNACSRPDFLPAGVIKDVTFVVDDPNSNRSSIPKDGAVVLSAEASEVTDDALRARVKLLVTEVSTGRVIEGTFVRPGRRDGDLLGGPVVFAWRPKTQATLPVGKLDVKLEMDTGKRLTLEVDVQDRLLELPMLSITSSVSTVDLVDGAAPRIQCKQIALPGTCDAGQHVSRPSRFRRVIALGFNNDHTRDPLFPRTIRAYSKDANGNRSSAAEVVNPGSSSTVFNEVAAQYCVEITTTATMDPAKEAAVESCSPHGDLSSSLTLTDQEQRDLVNAQLTGCESPEFPAGSGMGASSENAAGGCSMIGGNNGNHSSTSKGLLPLLGMLLMLRVINLMRNIVRRA